MTARALSDGERARYARHIQLPQLGESGQQRLLAASCLVIGVGGLGSPAKITLRFTAQASHPQLTIVSMLAPSPDWFVGLYNHKLMKNGDWIDTMTVPATLWDAGTDSGPNYTSPNQNTNPAEPITLLTTSPFDNGVALGTFTFTRTDTPPAFNALGPGLAGTNGVPALSDRIPGRTCTVLRSSTTRARRCAG